MCEIELLETLNQLKHCVTEWFTVSKLFIRIAFQESFDSDRGFAYRDLDQLQSGFRATSPDLKWCFVNLYQGSPTLLLEIYRPTDVSSNPNQTHLHQLIKVSRATW